MADVNPTENSIAPGTNCQKVRVMFGATITQGMAVYYDSAAGENDYKIADCTDAAKDAVAGIALSSGADGQPGFIATGGNVTFGSDLTAGTVYVLSTAGLIAPAADLNLSTDYATVIGVASSATNLVLALGVSGYKTP